MQSSNNDVDYERDRAMAKDFLLDFAEIHGGGRYMNILQEVANRKTRAIEIELEDLFNYKDSDDEFVRKVTENTKSYIVIFLEDIGGSCQYLLSRFPTMTMTF